MSDPSRQALLGARPVGDPVANAIRHLAEEVNLLEVPDRLDRMGYMPVGPWVNPKSDAQREHDYRKSQFLDRAKSRLEAAQPEGAAWYKGVSPALRDEIEAYHKPGGFFSPNQYRQALQSESNSLAGNNPLYHAGRWASTMAETPFRWAAMMGDKAADAVGSAVLGDDYQPLPASAHAENRRKYLYSRNTLTFPFSNGPSYWADNNDIQIRAARQTPAILGDGSFVADAQWHETQLPFRAQARNEMAERNYASVPPEASPAEVLMERGVSPGLAYATGLPAAILIDPIPGVGQAAKLSRLPGQSMRALRSLGPDVFFGAGEVTFPPVTGAAQDIVRLLRERDDGR